MDINSIMAGLEAKHPGEKEYLQAVREVLMSVEEVYNQHPEFERNKIIERMVEPDRIVTFRVTWIDDRGEVQNNIGYRVQQCHRPVQGWHPLPRFSQPLYIKIPRIRANFQKRTHHPSDGRRQRRQRLLAPRQERP